MEKAYWEQRGIEFHFGDGELINPAAKTFGRERVWRREDQLQGIDACVMHRKSSCQPAA